MVILFLILAIIVDIRKLLTLEEEGIETFNGEIWKLSSYLVL